MVIPIGQPFKMGQVLHVYTRDAVDRVRGHKKNVGMYYITMTSEPRNTWHRGYRSINVIGLAYNGIHPMAS